MRTFPPAFVTASCCCSFDGKLRTPLSVLNNYGSKLLLKKLLRVTEDPYASFALQLRWCAAKRQTRVRAQPAWNEQFPAHLRARPPCGAREWYHGGKGLMAAIMHTQGVRVLWQSNTWAQTSIAVFLILGACAFCYWFSAFYHGILPQEQELLDTRTTFWGNCIRPCGLPRWHAPWWPGRPAWVYLLSVNSKWMGGTSLGISVGL